MLPQISTSTIMKTFCVVTFWIACLSFSDAKKSGGGGAGRGGGIPSGGAPGGGRVGAPPPVAAPPPRVGGVPPVASGPLGGSKGSGSRLGTGLALGAAGGLAAGVLGASIAHSIAQGSTGGYHDGRYYYYGDRNYPGPSSGYMKCTLQVGGDFNATYKDGAPIKELVYECNRATDTCCANGCCPITTSSSNSNVIVRSQPVQRPVSIWSILIPLLVLFIAIAVIGFFVIKCIRRRRREATSEQQVYFDANGAQTTVQSDGKHWAPQQPYYPPEPVQQPGFGYPQQAPPPPYQHYGYPSQPQQPYPQNWRPS